MQCRLGKKRRPTGISPKWLAITVRSAHDTPLAAVIRAYQLRLPEYLVYEGGGTGIAAGTSAFAPVLGAMMSLVNAARFRGGGKPIGWINPILYSYAALFANDVTVGKNSCSVLITCCKEGLNAARGWDPAKGLRTWNFKKFKDSTSPISKRSAVHHHSVQ